MSPLLILAVWALVSFQQVEPIEGLTCGQIFIRKGCFKDESRPLNELVLFDRKNIDWHNWDKYMEGLVCRCALETKKRGFLHFGLQYYGECWSGNNVKYDIDGLSDNCITRGMDKCNNMSDICVGKSWTNYVYALMQPTTPPPPNTECKDHRLDCARFADDGYCVAEYPAILKNCPFSCKRCQ